MFWLYRKLARTTEVVIFQSRFAQDHFQLLAHGGNCPAMGRMAWDPCTWWWREDARSIPSRKTGTLTRGIPTFSSGQTSVIGSKLKKSKTRTFDETISQYLFPIPFWGRQTAWFMQILHDAVTQRKQPNVNVRDAPWCKTLSCLTFKIQGIPNRSFWKSFWATGNHTIRLSWSLSNCKLCIAANCFLLCARQCATAYGTITTRTCEGMDVHTHKYIYIHIFVCTHTHTNAAWTYTCLHLYMHPFIRV